MSRKAVVMPLPSGVTRVTRKGKDYWYHQERRGKPDAGPRTTLPEYGTREFWAALAKITGEAPAVPTNTVADLITAYKAQPKWIKRPKSTQETYNAAFKHIEAAWGKLDPASISIAGVTGLQERLSDRPTMANLTMVLVRALMKLAVQRGMRIDNPAREIEDLETEPDEAKPLTPAAWAALTSGEAPEALRRYAILGRAIGQRISDILPLTPSNRDQDGIELSITKLGGKLHWCPLRQDEIAEIDGWRVFKHTRYIGRIGAQYTDDSFRIDWNAYAKTKAGAALKGFTPHDLRATKVCDERIRGKSHQQIAAMVGMSVNMVMKYSRHIDQRQAARGTGTEQDREKSGKS